MIASNVKAGSNSKRNKKGLFAELEESSIAPPPLLGGGALQNVFTDESQENNNNMMIFQQHPTARTELPDTNRMIFEGSTDKKE